MKNILRKIYNRTLFGRYIMRNMKQFYDYMKYIMIPDKLYLETKFKKKQGFKLDLKDPKTLNEKMQWLKLNDITPLHIQCADKYEVRSFVEKVVGSEYLVPLCYVTDSSKDLIIDNLPKYRHFIVKTTHDSSGGIIVRDINKLNIQSLQERFKYLLKSKHYRGGRENQYKYIKPRIVVESLLEDKNGKIPNDYKFHCFNGKAKVVYVSIDREGKNKRNIYDIDWNPLYFTWAAKGKDVSDIRGEEIERPKNYEKMIEIAEKLASYFIYVRVDLFNVDGKIYVGELTFHHGSGFEHIRPIEWDYKMGEMLKLPSENHVY